jgi:hypothetical protein
VEVTGSIHSSKPVIIFLILCLGLTVIGPASIRAAEGDSYKTEMFQDFISSEFKILRSKLFAGMLRELDGAKNIEIEIISKSLSHRLGGRFDRIIISVDEGRIEGMRIHQVYFDFQKPVIDLNILWGEEKLRLKSAAQIDMNLVVHQDDLNEFLKIKANKLKISRPEIELKPGQISLKGAAQWWILQSEFWARGYFFIHDGNKIYFYPNKLEISRVRMPSMVIKQLVKKINPVLDMSTLPFKVKLETILLEEGVMTITSFENKSAEIE